MLKTKEWVGGLNAAVLKALAMVFMLMDHIWATVASDLQWLTCVGRVAFPLFAFLIAEGYTHTSDFKRYLKRIFVFALIAELPFNLMTAGSLINPLHQNILFTFCIALLLLRQMDRAWTRGWMYGLPVTAACAVLGYVLGFVTFVDYYGYGVLMVLVFWLTGRMPCGRLVQLLAIGYINLEMMGGFGWELEVLGRTTFVPQQGLALLALPLIWLYNGKRGPGGKAWQWFGYAFYPAHILVLALLMQAGIHL